MKLRPIHIDMEYPEKKSLLKSKLLTYMFISLVAVSLIKVFV
jgi:hypothetical protein